MIRFLKADKKIFLFLLLLGLYWGIAFEPEMLTKTPYKNAVDTVIILGEWCFVIFMAVCVAGLLAINKYVFALVFPLLNIVCTILTYYLMAFNYSFNPEILDATLHCDTRTAAAFVSWQLMVFVLINFIIAVVFVWYRFRIGKIAHPFWYAISMLAIILVINHFPYICGYINNRVPYNIYYVYKDYSAVKKIGNFYRPDETAGATCNEDSLIVVYVQGESLRRENLSLNGYERQTTPLLQRDSVISFSDIYSPYSYTDASLAYVFTNADSLHEDRAYTNRSFISFFKKCGFKTIWIGNQELGDGYIYYAHECDSIVLPNKGKSIYNFQPYTWVDGDLLPPYRQFISQPVNGGKLLAIVHTIGSHYIYNTHYTKDFAVFNPGTKSRIIALDTRQELINSYDNSIRYMDFVVDSMIQTLKNKNAVLIFLSDHGQSLGENGKWLHGHNEEANNHHPACFVWLSDKYKQQNPNAEATLKHNAPLYFNTSFLFPSILDAAHIRTPLLDTSMSIFRRKN